MLQGNHQEEDNSERGENILHIFIRYDTSKIFDNGFISKIYKESYISMAKRQTSLKMCEGLE